MSWPGWPGRWGAAQARMTRLSDALTPVDGNRMLQIGLFAVLPALAFGWLVLLSRPWTSVR